MGDEEGVDRADRQAEQETKGDKNRLGERQIAAGQNIADRHRDAAEREVQRQQPDAQRLADDGDAQRRSLAQDKQQQEGLQQSRPGEPRADEQRRGSYIGDGQIGQARADHLQPMRARGGFFDDGSGHTPITFRRCKLIAPSSRHPVTTA